MNKENKETEQLEKRSYAFIFFVLSTLTLLSGFWAVKWEFFDLRPWKKYQKEYINLKLNHLNKKLKELKEQKSNPEFSGKYANALENLQAERTKFESVEIQSEYHKIQTVTAQKKKELKKTISNFQDIRGVYLEIEYLYYKNQNPEDKKRFISLGKESEFYQQKQDRLSKEIDSLKSLLDEIVIPLKRAESEVKNLQSDLNDVENEIHNAKKQIIEIKQIFIEDINKADRCVTCHIGIEEKDEVSTFQPFSKHPWKHIYLDKHPPSTFGCTFCHLGEGRATSAAWKAHGEDEHWSETMLHGEMIQATCQNCHGDVKKLKGADVLIEGAELVEKNGCYGCHQIAGFEGLRKVGPDLTYIGEKVNYSWIVQWIEQPKKYISKARMPNFTFSETEAKSIADYMISMTSDVRKDVPQAEIDWERFDRGKALWGQSRCSICHVTDEQGGAHAKSYAPDLTKIGSKTDKEWLFNWLKEPKKYFPETNMPRFRFTDDEILDLVEYMTGEFVDWEFEPQFTEPEKITMESINKGKILIQEYGCFGCHNVQGMENLKEIGPFLRGTEVTYISDSEATEMVGSELTGIGSKPVEQIDFGFVKNIEKDRESYFKQKLKEPRSFRENLKMPDLGFNDDEISALITLLTGFFDKDIPTRFKRPKEVGILPQGEFGNILEDVKCLTCHSINGTGEDYAPDLSFESSKVQRKWLEEFLGKPDVIRPLLQQMPRFQLVSSPKMINGNLKISEIEIITRYIENVLVSDDIPEVLPEDNRALKTQINDGEKLYNNIGCIACHQIGSEGGAIGPNLSNVGNRLKPGYIYAHLQNPQRFKEDIVEPNYKLTNTELISLTQYLITLKEK